MQRLWGRRSRLGSKRLDGWRVGGGAWEQGGQGLQYQERAYLYPAQGEGALWASSLRWLPTNKGSCCHAEWVGRRVGSGPRLKSQRIPEASPESGQVTPNSSLAQRACYSRRKPKEAQRDTGGKSEVALHPPHSQGRAYAYSTRAHSERFSISRVEKPWPGWGNLYFTLRCTQLGSDWHPVLICKKGSICIHQDSLPEAWRGLAP